MTELHDVEHKRAQSGNLLPEQYDAYTTLHVQGKGWIYVKVTIRKMRVIDVHVSEPDMKMMIMDQFKIAMAKHWKAENG